MIQGVHSTLDNIIQSNIFVIDAAKLRQMNILVEPTTVLANRWGFKYNWPDRLHYITSSHCLARFWIPAECIVRKVSFPDFKEACIISGIVDGMYPVDQMIKTLMRAGSSNEVSMGKALLSDAF